VAPTLPRVGPTTLELEIRQAGGLSRLMAAIVDTAILASIDAIVLYLTVRLCGLQLTELDALPMVPLMAFLVLLDAGYFVAFTAIGGQSVGKMAAGIKVVKSRRRAVGFKSATIRTLGYLVSVLPVGIGFVRPFAGQDGRPLHDRLANTRVIRV
jgi:uncharacterized RDD family membrane protein YckC